MITNTKLTFCIIIFQVINTHDQDETDFTKAIKVLKNQCEMSNIEVSAN